MIHSTLLYSGPLVSITDVCCRSPACEGTEDEHASSHQAVFTRSGLFVKRTGRKSVLAESAHVLFFARNEAYRVTHPVPGGIVAVPSARRQSTRESTAKARRRLVDETKLVLATRPSQSLSLSELARTVASSPFHLSRVFREEVGMPIHQYVLRLRLALALERLAQGEVELSSLALELGFSSHSHFATTFKRTFGSRPSSFRMS